MAKWRKKKCRSRYNRQSLQKNFHFSQTYVNFFLRFFINEIRVSSPWATDKKKIRMNYRYNFQDFVTGLSILSRGSLEEKLKWTFSLYDINGDGCITKDEMTDIITAIYDLMGKHIEPIDEATLKDRVDRIFQVTRWSFCIRTTISPPAFFFLFYALSLVFVLQKMDMNQDGVVTIEEFLDCCTADNDISASMEVFDFSFWPKMVGEESDDAISLPIES